ncbi:MAG: hypothetical protein C5B50_09705 [Verrucomicrobia bacterium]|nr:MAG: hypothetical protein C5B50_09705 [Verrucomicrobiota bacterium]
MSNSSNAQMSGLVPSWVRLFTFLLTLACFGEARADEPGPLLTNALSIISLPADQAARSLKVSVTGIVTASDPALKGRFFMQDPTSGIFVDNFNGQRPEPGIVVEVTGITHPGAYAPIITAPTVRQIGAGPLPAAKTVAIERLMSGAEDSQRIEITGVVREAHTEGARLVADLVAGGYRFRIYAPLLTSRDPQALVAAQLRVRGTAAEAHNRSLRQLIAVEVYVPVLEDLVVAKSETINPFEEAIVPLDSLAQYRPDNSLNRRAHIRGVVTLQRLGENLFVQDKSGGLQVQSRQLTPFEPGEVVEAVGFPTFDQNLPVLQDAVLRGTSGQRVTVVPKPVSIGALQNGLHHADFVSLTARLLNCTVTRMADPAAGGTNTSTTLALQSSNVIFAAQAESVAPPSNLEAIPIGSTVAVCGVCLSEIDNDGRVKSFKILVRSPDTVRVLAKPSWFTPRRMLVILGMVSVVSIIVLGWLVMVSRQNAALNFQIGEREKAQRQLQEAHDLLEERVRQRTKELKFQITARKEAEVQFKAVLSERTRLAQELHDTVEQTLTGIALQLDTAARLYESKPESARNHLGLARNLMGKSQTELRRSVWDLRKRAIEQFDLPGALVESARQLTQPCAIKVDLQTKGNLRSLPEVVEENLLRISQEAITNVIKHARATQVDIELQFEAERVIMQIQDNGIGFDLQTCAGPSNGHFGLLGMSERARRIGGTFLPSSRLGQGTVVRVEVPLGPAEAFQWPHKGNGAPEQDASPEAAQI